MVTVIVHNLCRRIINQNFVNFLSLHPAIVAKYSSSLVGNKSSQFAVGSTVPGKVKVKSCGNVNIKPAQYSESGNSSYCMVLGESGLAPKLQETSGQISFTVSSNSQQAINIEVPHHYDVSIENEGEEVNITLEKLESESVSVNGKIANCFLYSMKGMKTEIFLESGSVDFQNGFIGNVTASLEKGKVNASRIQGSDVSLHVGEGSIDVTSLYSSNQTDISMGNGDVKIGSCHGNTRAFISEGNFSADSVDGELLASVLEEGHIDIHLSLHKNVQLLACRGSVNVSISETGQTKLDAECDELVTDDKIVFHITNRDERSTRVEGVVMGSTHPSEDTAPAELPRVKVKANTLSLKVKEWISSFKFSSDS